MKQTKRTKLYIFTGKCLKHTRFSLHINFCCVCVFWYGEKNERDSLSYHLLLMFLYIYRQLSVKVYNMWCPSMFAATRLMQRVPCINSQHKECRLGFSYTTHTKSQYFSVRTHSYTATNAQHSQKKMYRQEIPDFPLFKCVVTSLP